MKLCALFEHLRFESRGGGVSITESFRYHWCVGLSCFGISWVSGCFRCCEVRIPFFCGFWVLCEPRISYRVLFDRVKFQLESVWVVGDFGDFWRVLEDFGFLRICGKRIFDRPMWIR